MVEIVAGKISNESAHEDFRDKFDLQRDFILGRIHVGSFSRFKARSSENTRKIVKVLITKFTSR